MWLAVQHPLFDGDHKGRLKQCRRQRFLIQRFAKSGINHSNLDPFTRQFFGSLNAGLQVRAKRNDGALFPFGKYF